MQCTNCGADNPDKLKYCTSCGKPLPAAPKDAQAKDAAHAQGGATRKPDAAKRPTQTARQSKKSQKTRKAAQAKLAQRSSTKAGQTGAAQADERAAQHAAVPAAVGGVAEAADDVLWRSDADERGESAWVADGPTTESQPALYGLDPTTQARKRSKAPVVVGAVVAAALAAGGIGYAAGFNPLERIAVGGASSGASSASSASASSSANSAASSSSASSVKADFQNTALSVTLPQIWKDKVDFDGDGDTVVLRDSETKHAIAEFHIGDWEPDSGMSGRSFDLGMAKTGSGSSSSVPVTLYVADVDDDGVPVAAGQEGTSALSHFLKTRPSVFVEYVKTKQGTTYTTAHIVSETPIGGSGSSASDASGTQGMAGSGGAQGGSGASAGSESFASAGAGAQGTSSQAGSGSGSGSASASGQTSSPDASAAGSSAASGSGNASASGQASGTTAESSAASGSGSGASAGSGADSASGGSSGSTGAAQPAPQPAQPSESSQSQGGTSNDGSQAATGPAPFWGVWIHSFDTQEKAQNAANEAAANGYPAQVYLSSQWSGMISDPWWRVAAYTFADEQSARAMLQAVRDAGYPDAYVQYSGSYTG